MTISDCPLLTDVYNTADDFVPLPNSVYMYGMSPEERSDHGHAWMQRNNEVLLCRITDQGTSNITVAVGELSQTHALRSQSQLATLLGQFKKNVLYLDITGLSHHVWAPILRAALSRGMSVKGVYVEPAEYRFSEAPTEGDIFDLSERITGISPIPGFATLGDANDPDFCFVPLLGFEGPRFAYLVEQVQPPGRNIIPVIGVPGFRPEFPFYAYHGNRLPLTQTRAWQNVRYAIANCPFNVFYVLSDIAAQYPQHMLKIAPIGTKPHALGAVLFAINSPRHVELVYDHPVRKPGRTKGASRLLVYHLSMFASAPGGAP